MEVSIGEGGALEKIEDMVMNLAEAEAALVTTDLMAVSIVILTGLMRVLVGMVMLQLLLRGKD